MQRELVEIPISAIHGSLCSSRCGRARRGLRIRVLCKAMERRTILQGLAVSAATAPAAAGSSAWKNSFAQQLRDDLLVHWRSEREYTLEVLEAMPAEHFDFKPVDEQRTFAEQLQHTGLANAHYFASFAKDAGPPADPTSLSKESVRKCVAATFDYSESVLSSLSESDFSRRDVKMRFPGRAHTAQDVFLRAYVHTAHHRGQIIAYLRLKGITPPPWRFPPNGKA